MYKLVEENDKTYKIQHPDGTHFNVAKKGLGKALTDKIKGMSAPVKMADGGQVLPLDLTAEEQGIKQEQSKSGGGMADIAKAGMMLMMADGGYVPSDTFMPTDLSKPPIPASQMPQPVDPVTEALNAPVRPEYQALVDHYKALGVGGLGNGPETRAKLDMNKMDELSQASPGSMSQLDAAKLREIQANASPQRTPASAEKPIVTSQASPAPAASAPASPELQQTSQLAGTKAAPGVMDIYQQSLAQQQSGIKGMASAAKAQAGDIQGANEAFVKQTDDLRKASQARMDDVLAENKALYDNMMSKKIDPNRVWNEMRSGNKVMATIGIILSGMGSRGKSDNNAALNVINKTIERDIDAQKADQAKAGSLYNMNLQKYRNVQEAETATRLQMNTAFQAQLSSAAAKFQGTEAGERAKMMLGQLQQQQIPMLMEMQKMAVNAKSLGAGGQEGGIPVGGEPLALLGDDKYRSNRVVVNGRAYQSVTPEEGKEVRTFQAQYEPVKKAIQQLNDLKNEAGVTIKGTPAYERAQALMAALTPMVNKLHGLNRLSEEDIKLMQSQLSDPTKYITQFAGSARNNQIMKNLQDDMDALYKTKLTGFGGAEQYKTFKPLAVK